MHTVLKDLQISGMAARLMMWLHARSCVLPSFEWTSSNYHCSLPDSAYRQQQALLDHQTWLQLKDTRSDNFLHSRTKNAVILVLPGPKITPDQKFRDRTTSDKGYGHSPGRPKGSSTTRGFKVGMSGGRPKGTTANEGYGTSGGDQVAQQSRKALG